MTLGIILLNLGGPDSLQAVRPFLYNLFSDRQIIRLGPSFMQKPLAWLISTIRSKKTEQYYKLIGGKSPILDITKAQAKALEESLNSELSTQNSSQISVTSRLMTPWIWERIWRSVKWRLRIAPVGHADPHVPHPLHKISLTTDTFFSSSKWIALYGQTFIHVWHPQQISSFTTAVVTSTSTFPLHMVARILAVAALAWATESVISFGPWQLPTI